MRATLLITAKDLRQRLRDRSVLFVGLLVPLGLAVVFDLTFGGAGEDTFVPRYGVVVQDDGEAGAGFAQLLSKLDAEGILDLSTLDSPRTAVELAEDGELQGAFVVPEGFTDSVTSGGSPRIDVIGTVEAPLSREVARSIADGFAAEVVRRQLTVATTQSLSEGPVDVDAALAAVDAHARPIRLTTGAVAVEQLDQTTYLAAAMAVFFLFFTVQFGVLSMLEERQNGTLPRLYAAPLARGVVPAAKTLTSAVLGVASLTVLLVATSLLLGARWGSPFGVAVLVVCAVVAATSITAALGTLARTPEQANIAQSVIAVLLGALGGVFFDVTQGSAVLERLSLLTPHQWFLRGLGSVRADGLAGSLTPALALLTFAAVGVGLTAILSRRRAVV